MSFFSFLISFQRPSVLICQKRKVEGAFPQQKNSTDPRAWLINEKQTDKTEVEVLIHRLLFTSH